MRAFALLFLAAAVVGGAAVAAAPSNWMDNFNQGTRPADQHTNSSAPADHFENTPRAPAR